MRATSPRTSTRCADAARRAGVAFAAVALAALAPAALAHPPAGGVPIGEPGWSFEPWVTVPLLVSGLLYALGFRALSRATRHGRPLRRAQAVAFWGGWLELVIALVSPIDALADQLFWVHMIQHELLMIVAAPLLVLGRPFPVFLWALPPRARHLVARGTRRALGGLWRAVSTPAAASALQAAALWGWHLPAAFSAGLVDPDVHTAQHAGFLFSATLFWWSLGEARRSPARDGVAALWIFATMLHTGVLGALLTFSPSVWYVPYEATAPDHGFSAIDDQSLGGLVMWVPGGIAYLVLGLWRAAGLLRGPGVPALDLSRAGTARPRRSRR
jgi:cytochrome c oxidase assembly factor CtaG